jgi:hypothetical protein
MYGYQPQGLCNFDFFRSSSGVEIWIVDYITDMGKKNLNSRRVGMIFDLDENFTNYFLNLLPSFSDDVKSAGPP